MANLNKTKLDASQCVVGAYDGVEEANRVLIVGGIEMAIQISAADGDSVASYSAKSDATLATTQTTGTTNGTVLATITGAADFSKVVVYSEALAGVSGAGQVTLQASPSDSGSLWATVGSTLSSPAAPGTSVSSVTEFVAKRLRLVSSTAPTGGSVQYTILLGS